MNVSALHNADAVEIRLIAGQGGEERAIAAAHVSDGETPWEWLEPGELLLTTGHSLPVSAADQVAFVAALARVGASGLVIAEGPAVPQLSEDMCRAADEHSLPLLRIPGDIPLIKLTRLITKASTAAQQLRLSRTVRMYDRLRDRAVDRVPAVQLLDGLAGDLDYRLWVCDPVRFRPIFPGTPGPPDDLRAVLEETTSPGHAVRSRVWRLRIRDGVAWAVPIPSSRAAMLVGVPRNDCHAGLALLQHAAGIVALELDTLAAELQHRRQAGTDLLRRMVSRDIEGAVAMAQLAEQGLSNDLMILAVVELTPSSGPASLARFLTDRHVPYVALPHPEMTSILVGASGEPLRTLLSGVDGTTTVGISDPFRGPGDVRDAFREASCAFRAAKTENQSVLRYGEASSLFWPRTLSEARAAVERVLGPVIVYDKAHGSQLLLSLETFLKTNRSWLRATAVLHVHKQTLVYRMRRVEELTDRKVNDIGDITEFWLALRAYELTRDAVLSQDIEAYLPVP